MKTNLNNLVKKQKKHSFSSFSILRFIIILIVELCIFTSSAFAKSLGAGVSFLENFEQPGKWAGLQVVNADRVQLVTSPVQYGTYAARIEVRPGDDPIHSSGERAEVRSMLDENGNDIYENEASGTQYYAFSVRLDPNWQPPEKDATGYQWGIIFQLHGPDNLNTSPAFAIQATDKFSVDLHSGDLDTSVKSMKYKSYQLTNNSLNIGQWVNFVVKIKYAKDFTGSVDVWRRDEGQTQFAQVLSVANVPTLQYRSSQGEVGDHYWKYGFYRSKQTTITNVLFLGGLARGTTFDNVVAAAFPQK